MPYISYTVDESINFMVSFLKIRNNFLPHYINNLPASRLSLLLQMLCDLNWNLIFNIIHTRDQYYLSNFKKAFG